MNVLDARYGRGQKSFSVDFGCGSPAADRGQHREAVGAVAQGVASLCGDHRCRSVPDADDDGSGGSANECASLSAFRSALSLMAIVLGYHIALGARLR